MEPELLKAVDSVNQRQKIRMAERIADYFSSQGGVAGKTLAVWGLAFKANTDDIRESAAIAIIRELTAKGMRVRAFDPAAGGNAARAFEGNALVTLSEKQYEALPGASALLVATEWNQFRTPDFDRIKAELEAPVLFDGRNLYSGSTMARRGFAYFCVGKG